MKKLLLHIGYPKTATTTLQEEVFVQLHKQDRINYLGRTTKSSHTRTGLSKFNGIDLVWELRQHFFLGKNLNHHKVLLKSNLLNVISDENLTFHDFLHYAESGKSVDYTDFPHKLKAILGTDVEVTILLTLRNQTDLVFSSYLQKIKFIKRYIGDYSFYDFLSNAHNYRGRNQETHLAIYDFNKITKLWTSVFSSRVTFLFFEDFLQDKDKYFSKLSKLLPASPKEIQELVGTKHYRKKDKSNEFIKISYKTLSKFGRFIALLVPQQKLQRSLEQRQLIRFALYLRCKEKIMFKYIKLEVPKPTKEEQKFIKDFFNISNLEFAKSYNLDLDKMTEYNYLK